MDMIGRIRRMHSRGKKGVREIARTTGLSRNTVAKWLRKPVASEPKYRRGDQPGKLTAYHEATRQPRATINLANAKRLIDDRRTLVEKETTGKGGRSGATNAQCR